MVTTLIPSPSRPTPPPTRLPRPPNTCLSTVPPPLEASSRASGDLTGVLPSGHRVPSSPAPFSHAGGDLEELEMMQRHRLPWWTWLFAGAAARKQPCLLTSPPDRPVLHSCAGNRRSAGPLPLVCPYAFFPNAPHTPGEPGDTGSGPHCIAVTGSHLCAGQASHRIFALENKRRNFG